MRYLKNKVIIDFLIQVESLIHSLNTKFEPIYYFTLGNISQSYLKSPSALQSTLESFSLLHQYEEFQAISQSQRTKLFIDMLIDPKGNLEQKIYALTSEDQEENKENRQSNQNSNYAKELRQNAIELYEKAELKFAEHLALIEEEDARMLPIDFFMWGFFTAYLQSETVNTIDTLPVFEKLLTLRQAQISSILTHNQKMRFYIKLYNDWERDLNAAIIKLLENPSLGAEPLASLVVDEQEMNEVMLQQFSLEEKFEQEKARQDKEIKDHEGILCNLCLLDLYEKGEDIFFMDACLHNYHESCLSDYLHHQIKEKKFPVKCPDESCKEEFSGADLKELMDEENIENFYEAALESFVLKNGKDITYCPTPDCTYVFSLSEDLVSFECPVCCNDYCLKCKNRMHQGNCGDHGFIELAEYLHYKPCPSCKFWIEKTDGCNHMTCRCGFEFCYNCGQDYQNHSSCYYEDLRDEINNNGSIEGGAREVYLENQQREKINPYAWENRHLLQGRKKQARIKKKKGKR